jgi:hypothetical protein
MQGRVVFSPRHHIPFAFARPARCRPLAYRIVSLAALLGVRTSLAQDVTARPGAFLAAQGADTVRTNAPPLFVARPDAAARQGSVSVGTAGRLTVTHQTDLSRRVRSTLDGSLGFESPGDRPRDGESGIRNGSFRWALSGGDGYHGEVGVIGDPASKTVRGSLEAPLPGASTLTAFGTTRWTNTTWGRERVQYGNVGLRTRLGSALFVQPDLHMLDIRTRANTRLLGARVRIEYRGAEFTANQERGFGRQMSARKTWGMQSSRLTLGAQVKQAPTQADGRLLELGVAHAELGGNLFGGHGSAPSCCDRGRSRSASASAPDWFRASSASGIGRCHSCSPRMRRLRSVSASCSGSSCAACRAPPGPGSGRIRCRRPPATSRTCAGPASPRRSTSAQRLRGRSMASAAPS